MAPNIVDKSRRNDRIATWVITGGGLFVVVAVIGILLLIAKVSLPLFFAPTAEKITGLSPELSQLVAVDESGFRQSRDLGESGSVSVQLLPDNRIELQRRLVETDILGNQTTREQQQFLTDPLPGAVSALWLGRQGQSLYAGTDNGWIIRWDIAEETARLVDKLQAFTDQRRITALTTLLGDYSLDRKSVV